MIAFATRILLGSFCKQGERRQLKLAVGLEFGKFKMRLFDFLRFCFFGRWIDLFDYGLGVFFNFEPGKKMEDKRKNPIFDCFNKFVGRLRESFRNGDERKLDDKEKRNNKNKNQNNIGSRRIEITKQELDNDRADQPPRFEYFSVKNNTSFDQSTKQSGACQCEEGEADDARGVDCKSRAQKVLKRAECKRQREKKRSDAQQSDDGISGIGPNLACEIMRRGLIRNKARERRIQWRVRKQA